MTAMQHVESEINERRLAYSDLYFTVWLTYHVYTSAGDLEKVDMNIYNRDWDSSDAGKNERCQREKTI